MLVCNTKKYFDMNHFKRQLLIFMMFVPLLSVAQEEYEPFIVEGKVWYYDYVTYVFASYLFH